MAVNCWKRWVIQTANKSHNTDSPLLEFAVAKKQKTEKSYREKSEKKKKSVHSLFLTTPLVEEIIRKPYVE